MVSKTGSALSSLNPGPIFGHFCRPIPNFESELRFRNQWLRIPCACATGGIVEQEWL
jgi:hypothetical protein